jgi:hypothetical protein
VIADDVVLFVPLAIDAPVKFQKMWEPHPLVAVEAVTIVPLEIGPAAGEKVGVAAAAMADTASPPGPGMRTCEDAALANINIGSSFRIS